MPALTSSRLDAALESLRKGGMVLLIDDEDRENEGDLVLAAEFANAENINFLCRHARGLICLALPPDRIDALKLAPMVPENQSLRQTAFTVSIEARDGVTTGISAPDRARTIQVAMENPPRAEALIRPGHIFPLRAQAGGVLERAGHTEGSVDLTRLAGLQAGAVICEIMNDDGTMARLPDLERFSAAHGIPILTIQEIIAHRMQHESLIERVAEAEFPSRFGTFKMVAYRTRPQPGASDSDTTEHLAIVRTASGRVEDLRDPALVRVHSECVTGEALGSLRCDCGDQLQSALQQIHESKNGALIYIRKHEGRGIGLANKVRAYALQDQGMDTVDANTHLGLQADLRHYGVGAQILRDLGLRQIRLLTNNPRKIVGIQGFGIEVVERMAIATPSNPHNQAYLTTKRDRLGHSLEGAI